MPTGPCGTLVGSAFVIQASGTGDFAIDGNYAQLQSAFGSGYRISLSANRLNAQEFTFNADCTVSTTPNAEILMIGGITNLHYVYGFPSTADASALVNVSWEVLICTQNADFTLSCTSMSQSIFQATPGDSLLQLGDQNYGEQVTLNIIPVLV